MSRKVKCEICGVRTCRVGNDKRIFMAKFPLNADRCKQWVRATGKEDLAYVPIEKLHQLKHICERHFTSKDFLQSTRTKMQLKRNAIPTVQISSTPLPDEVLAEFPLHIAFDQKINKLGENKSDNQCSDDAAKLPTLDRDNHSSILDVELEKMKNIAERALAYIECKTLISSDMKESSLKGNGEDGSKHPVSRCRSCSQEIARHKYVCLQCTDFEFCNSCEANGTHSQHYVLRVPADKPHGEVGLVLSLIRDQLNEALESMPTKDVCSGEPEKKRTKAHPDLPEEEITKRRKNTLTIPPSGHEIGDKIQNPAPKERSGPVAVGKRTPGPPVQARGTSGTHAETKVQNPMEICPQPSNTYHSSVVESGIERQIVYIVEDTQDNPEGRHSVTVTNANNEVISSEPKKKRIKLQPDQHEEETKMERKNDSKSIFKIPPSGPEIADMLQKPAPIARSGPVAVEKRTPGPPVRVRGTTGIPTKVMVQNPMETCPQLSYTYHSSVVESGIERPILYVVEDFGKNLEGRNSITVFNANNEVISSNEIIEIQEVDNNIEYTIDGQSEEVIYSEITIEEMNLKNKLNEILSENCPEGSLIQIELQTEDSTNVMDTRNVSEPCQKGEEFIVTKDGDTSSLNVR